MNADVLRILDANANRAREALRVMEDHARFGLGDSELTGLAKSVRHALAGAVAALGVDAAVALRDTPGDVGTVLSTPEEQVRASVGAVVRAAGKRLSEAMRVLEEYGKTIDQETAGRIEALRYRGYEIEKRLAATLSARSRFEHVRVYVLVTESLCRRPWAEVVRSAAAGGANCFQLREKGLDDRALLTRARAFCALCRELGALAIVNDRADVALASGADGVHVGQDDLTVTDARRIVGPDRIVGVSTHEAGQVESAVPLCPDYVAVGPMFSTALKPEYGVAGPDMLRAARGLTALPLVAIGGIEAGKIAEVAMAGASCVAVCSAVIGADDPEAATRSLIERSSAVMPS